MWKPESYGTLNLKVSACEDIPGCGKPIDAFTLEFAPRVRGEAREYRNVEGALARGLAFRRPKGVEDGQ